MEIFPPQRQHRAELDRTGWEGRQEAERRNAVAKDGFVASRGRAGAVRSLWRGGAGSSWVESRGGGAGSLRRRRVGVG